MPNHVYQPKCTQSASSKEMNLHQASRDTLGLYRHHPKSPTVSSMLSTTSRTFTSQDPTDDPSGKPMGVRRTYIEDHAFLTSAPHSPFVCNHPTPSWTAGHPKNNGHLAPHRRCLHGSCSHRHRIRHHGWVHRQSSPNPIYSTPPTPSSETPMTSIFIPSSKTFCQSRPA